MLFIRFVIKISLILIVGISAFILSLFYQPFTEYLSRQGLEYIFDKNIDISKCRLTYERFDLQAIVDHNQSLIFEIKNITHSERQAILHFKGNVNSFSKIATIELPYIEADAKAVYKNGSNVSITANVLNGHIRLNLDLDKMSYKYSANDVLIESYLLQNSLPIYAKGSLFITGKGVIRDNYYVDYNITSYKLFIEDEVLSALPLKNIDHPLLLSLATAGNYNDGKLNIKLDVNTSIAEVSTPSFTYDLNQSTYKGSVKIKNKGIEEIPFKNIYLNTEISISDNNHTGKVKLTADEFTLNLDNLVYCPECNELKAIYLLYTLSKKPLNLTEKNRLFGNIHVGQETLLATITAGLMKEPAVFSLKNDELSLILNNMPLETILKITNQPNYARSNINIDFRSDLKQKPLAWRLGLSTQNLSFNDSISQELNITDPIQITVKAENIGNEIRIEPLIKSNIATLKETLLKYRTKSEKLNIHANIFDIKLPYYVSSHLKVDTIADLNRSSISAGRIRTDFETIDIDKLDWPSGKVESDITYSIGRLDRFAELDSNYTLNGEVAASFESGVLNLDVQSDQFGNIKIYKKDDNIRAKIARLPLREVFRLTSAPAILDGYIKASANYSSGSFHAKIHSGKITPSPELNTTLRTFSLQSNIDLAKSENRIDYYGKADIKTSNEILILENINIDTNRLAISSDYDLNITAMEKSTLLLPPELLGKLNISGAVSNSEPQLFSLKTDNFTLPLKWHQYLDENADSTLNAVIALQVEKSNGEIKLTNTLKTDILSTAPFNVNINMDRKSFKLECNVLTDLWLKDMNISLHGHYDDNMGIYLKDSIVRTRSQKLILEKLDFKNSEDVSGNFELELRKMDNPFLKYHNDACLGGTFQTFPKPKVTLETKSFDGDLKVRFDNEALVVEMKQLSIPLALAFAGKITPLQSGKVSGSVKLDSSALLENNTSLLKGTTDIQAYGLHINGVKIDTYLKHLRESQDLSLFNKDFKDLPIIRSVKNAPTILENNGSNGTVISHVQIRTLIQNGYLSCDDCALSTEKNLLAFQGGIDLDSEMFSDFYVGLLDPAGCAYFIQQVDGNLSEPQLELAAAGFNVVSGAVVSVASNVTDAAKWGTDAVKKTGSFVGNLTSYVPLVGGMTGKTINKVAELPSDATGKVISECIPFYTGTVKHPKKRSFLKAKKDR